jgi:glutaconate CoA-transferase subunit B
MCNQVVVVTQHEPRRFVEKVDFITSPGFLHGGTSRRESGLIYGGPAWVVTDLALLDFDRDSHRMRIRALQAGVTVEQAQAATGFELLVHDDVDEIPPVDSDELAVLRYLVAGDNPDQEVRS